MRSVSHTEHEPPAVETNGTSENPAGSAPRRLDLRAASGGGLFEYAPAPESVRPEIADQYGLFIGGEFVEPESGSRFASINPATEDTLAMVAEASAADVDRAVRAAQEALPAWSGLSGKDRGKYIYRIARRMQERARELAVLETLDGGKPIKESRDVDIPLACAHFFYHAGWADKLRFALPGRDPKPVGVCGQKESLPSARKSAQWRATTSASVSPGNFIKIWTQCRAGKGIFF